MLTERQKKILSCVVKEYVRTAEPVGSKKFLYRYCFGISPATVRSELFKLEQEGYLYHPHTSAGRIPTDKGYRYFVESLMEEKDLSRNEQMMLQEEVLKMKVRNTRLAKTTAKLLATLSKNLAISGLVEEEEYFQSGVKGLLSQPEFDNLDEVCRAVEVLDYLDSSLGDLVKKIGEGETKTFIGSENPLIESRECSLIISRYKIPHKRQTGIIAIMGPKRMKYSKNISLIKYMTDLLKRS